MPALLFFLVWLARIHLLVLCYIPDWKKSEKESVTPLTPSCYVTDWNNAKNRELLKLRLNPDTSHLAASNTQNFANSIDCRSDFGLAINPSIVLDFRRILTEYWQIFLMRIDLLPPELHPTFLFIPPFAVLLCFLSLYLIFLEDEYLQSSVHHKYKDSMFRSSAADSEGYRGLLCNPSRIDLTLRVSHPLGFPLTELSEVL